MESAEHVLIISNFPTPDKKKWVYVIVYYHFSSALLI